MFKNELVSWQEIGSKIINKTTCWTLWVSDEKTTGNAGSKKAWKGIIINRSLEYSQKSDIFRRNGQKFFFTVKINKLQVFLLFFALRSFEYGSCKIAILTLQLHFSFSIYTINNEQRNSTTDLLKGVRKYCQLKVLFGMKQPWALSVSFWRPFWTMIETFQRKINDHLYIFRKPCSFL